VSAPDPSELLAAYQAQVRARTKGVLPAGMHVEHDGPIVRTVGRREHGMVEYRDLGGIEGAELDELIERQIRVFADRGDRFEWKLHGHDQPADLPERLRAHGFVPEPQETLLIARVADLPSTPVPPPGVVVRELSAGELGRLDDWEKVAWVDQEVGIAERLAGVMSADPEGIRVVVAEAGQEIACACWLRFEGDTEFATLWGGATVPEWRLRGIYKATVAYRTRLAAERGRRYLQIDASDESRPILERLGFVVVTTTTPYIWTPPRA
jgi:GNAT superfamily N-acetyltransferase